MTVQLDVGSFKDTEIGAIPVEWEVVPFERMILNKRAQVVKVKRQHYKPFGKFPVVDQGQEFVAGYWDDPGQVYVGELPVIVFGDHTRIFKFIDLPFVAGADGVKVLLPNENVCDPHFLYTEGDVTTCKEVEYTRLSRISQQWQLMTVNLSDFVATGWPGYSELSSWHDMQELVFTFELRYSGNHGVIYLDNIKFCK